MVRWGIIGAGNIARRFASALKNEKDSLLYAISGRDITKLLEFKKNFDCEKVYLSYDELLNDLNVDVVYIALPNGLHKEYIVKAINKGKAVLCEKPACINESDLKEVITLARSKQVLFMEAMKNRLVPCFAKIEDSIKEIGDIKEINLEYSISLPLNYYQKKHHNLDKDNGGVLRDLGIYGATWIQDYFDVDNIVIDDVKVIWKDVDVQVNCFFHDDTKKGHVLVSYDKKPYNHLSIVGSNGSIELDDFHRPTSYICNGKEYEYPYEYDDFYSQIKHFVSLYKDNKKESPIVTYDSSLRSIRFLDKIRAYFTNYDENDLLVLERQERDLAFNSFNHSDVLDIANILLDLVKEYDRTISIMITMDKEDYVVYQYLMDGKSKRNIDFMLGKRKVSLLSNHSSAYMAILKKMGKSVIEGDEYIYSGGAFPIMVNGERVATVCVSGLHEGFDHVLLVRALEKKLNKKTLYFKKALF